MAAKRTKGRTGEDRGGEETGGVLYIYVYNPFWYINDFSKLNCVVSAYTYTYLVMEHTYLLNLESNPSPEVR